MYDELASVYEFLVLDVLTEPKGAVAAFAPVVDQLAPGARVLDCAAGTGQLAVGLALRGFEVTATDASEAMIARARALAERRGARLRTEVCPWTALARWHERFDAVFCVGNSLAHAEGPAGRQAALAAMAGVLGGGGMLILTSRNWELLRAARPGFEIADRLVERGGRSGLVIHSWAFADGWDEPHGLEIAVALLGDDGSVTTRRELLAFWPFTHETIERELRAAGLEPTYSSYEPGAERYLVSARRPAGAGAGAGSPRRAR